MTREPDSLAIQTGANDIRSASEWLDRFCSERAVPPEQIQRLDVCLNEVLANIGAHGGASARDTPVLVSMALTCQDKLTQASLTVSDSGKPFNPLNAVAKPPVQTLADAAPGGLGLTMIRHYADGLAYDRIDGRNCLDIRVHWTRTSL